MNDNGIEKGFAMGAASVIMMLAIIFFVHEADYREQVNIMTGKPKYDAQAQLKTACNKVLARVD